ncbi:MAG: hypothetical protein JXR03_00385 [Cyclobacteriaceae bacterium]
MKNKIILLVLLIGGVFMACEEDYVAPNDHADVAWYTSIFRKPFTDYQININDFVSFSDLSVGAVSHRWSIDEGNMFLKGPLSSRDTVFDEFIIHPGDTMTSDKTIHVLFMESGVQKVKLYNVFNDSVSYRGLDTISTVLIDGKWVMENEFIVDVFDTIQAEYEIYKFNEISGEYDDKVTLGTDTIEIEAAQALRFVDKTTIGRPNARKWNVAGTTSFDSIADIVFTRVGVVEGFFTSSREGLNTPTDSHWLRMTNPIKVLIPSAPFTIFGDVVELEDETIQISFNGEIDAFIGQEEFFEVMIDIDGTPTRFDVSTAAVDPDDATKINLIMKDPIYRPDVITVSYTGFENGGSIRSYERELQNFSGASVAMHNVNLWDSAEYGFEDGGTWGFQGGEINGTIEFVTDRFHSGTTSMKIETDGNGFVGAESVTPAILEVGKTYTFTWWSYYEEANKPNSWGPWIIDHNPEDETDRVTQQFWQGTCCGHVGDEWEQIEREWTVQKGAVKFWIRTNAAAIWNDDFWIVEKEERPM